MKILRERNVVTRLSRTRLQLVCRADIRAGLSSILMSLRNQTNMVGSVVGPGEDIAELTSALA